MSEVFQGLGVSSGVAVGQVLLRPTQVFPVVPVPVPPERVDEEISRFEQATRAAHAELEALRDRIREALGEPYAGILEAQLLILDDPRLVGDTTTRIRVGRVSAEWALKEVVGEFMRAFDAVDDDYLRERGGDLDDVHRRMQRLLRGSPSRREPIPDAPLVVVAHALGPSDAIALCQHHVVGLATDVGGRTSHTAILAQALAVPAVVGLHDLSLNVRSGDPVVLDGDSGRVEVHPEPESLAEAQTRQEAWQRRDSAMVSASHLPAVTRDGVEITLRANVEFPEEVDVAARYGAHGVGLYRSEFLFLSRSPQLPTEEEHYETYRQIGEKAAPHHAVIRTLDLGGEKYFHQVLDHDEPNPVLGLRAIRLCLKRPDIFRPQLRGLLRAAAETDLRLMIPLVASPEEIRVVRGLLVEEAETLRAEGKPARTDLEVGIMIEVPAAAVAADVLAQEADFFSIGTNDLIQYALAVDRGNDSVNHLYQPLHPAVLRMLRFVIQCADKQGIPVSLCGEMAADPALTGLLVGLGLREFSVQPRALGPVRESVRAASTSEFALVAEQALQRASADDVESYLKTAQLIGRDDA